MLLLWEEDPNYYKNFNVQDKNIWYIEIGFGHDELGDDRYEWSNINVITNFRDTIMRNHVLDDTWNMNKAIHWGLMVGDGWLPNDTVNGVLVVMKVKCNGLSERIMVEM